MLRENWEENHLIPAENRAHRIIIRKSHNTQDIAFPEAMHDENLYCISCAK